VQIRDFRDEDAPGVVTLLREARPANLWSVEAFRHFQRTRPERARFARWVAEEDGSIVGWASALLHANAEQDDSGGVHVTVAAARRRSGIGGALFELGVDHLRDAGARRVSSEAVDDDGFGFLERRGFHHGHTERFSRLDPRTADLSDLVDLRARLAGEGFTVAPFAECAPEGVHAVDAEASADVPGDVPFTYMPFDEWLDEHWRHPMLSKEGSFAVLHDGRPVSIGMLRVDRPGRRAGNDITGTLRAYRGRGLARLVKLTQLEWLAANGFESVVTSNDSTNAAMLAVNTRLGYVPFREERSYVRELEP
jgi:GNAT superfamily N-acetyltransferase